MQSQSFNPELYRNPNGTSPFAVPNRANTFDDIAVILSVDDAQRRYHQASMSTRQKFDILVQHQDRPHPGRADVLADLAGLYRTADACLHYLRADRRSRKPSPLKFLLGFVKSAWGPREWRLEGALLRAGVEASDRAKRWLKSGASLEETTIDEIVLPNILLDSTHQPEEQEQ